MLVYRGFKQKSPAATVLTIGNFDGLHLGHRALLTRLTEIARRENLLPAVITFEPHPREFFTPESAPSRLATLREKLEQFDDEGVKLTCVCHFNARLAAMTADEFIRDILVGCMQVKHLVIGDDFCFGVDRKGNLETLREAGARHGFTVEAMHSIVMDETRASSSAVRAALAEGRMEDAARLLGRPYTIDGRVVHGEKIGKQLGFATANIRIKHDRPPLMGVFAVEVRGLADGPHNGVANLGIRPSVGGARRPLLEVHLLDFCEDIYGKHLNVRFLHKLRNEVHFPDLDSLKKQIATDVETARNYFKH